MDSDGLLEAIVDWGSGDPNIVALILTGSRSRQELVDEFSDIDIEVVAQDVEALSRDDRWLERFGPLMVRQDLAMPDGSPTRLIFFAEGHKVDFTLCDQGRLDRRRAAGTRGSALDSRSTTTSCSASSARPGPTWSG